MVERGNRVVGLEFDPKAAESAREWCDDIRVGDVEAMQLDLPEGSFDVILCADVIEHLRDPGAFLERIRPLLRAGGRLVLSTPNIANWSIRAALLFGWFRYADQGILDRTHTHLFTRKTLLECIRDAGYTVESIDITVPVPLIGTPRVESIAHAIGRVRPTLFAFQFVVAASKPG
jgi:2-polyprenyl-3-methyl-5-hydroxy-6-metoxy-1,4-benzoquinol methylase